MLKNNLKMPNNRKRSKTRKSTGKSHQVSRRRNSKPRSHVKPSKVSHARKGSVKNSQKSSKKDKTFLFENDPVYERKIPLKLLNNFSPISAKGGRALKSKSSAFK
jgi:hypothetical protein